MDRSYNIFGTTQKGGYEKMGIQLEGMTNGLVVFLTNAKDIALNINQPICIGLAMRRLRL